MCLIDIVCCSYLVQTVLYHPSGFKQTLTVSKQQKLLPNMSHHAVDLTNKRTHDLIAFCTVSSGKSTAHPCVAWLQARWPHVVFADCFLHKIFIEFILQFPRLPSGRVVNLTFCCSRFRLSATICVLVVCVVVLAEYDWKSYFFRHRYRGLWYIYALLIYVCVIQLL